MVLLLEYQLKHFEKLSFHNYFSLNLNYRILLTKKNRLKTQRFYNDAELVPGVNDWNQWSGSTAQFERNEIDKVGYRYNKYFDLNGDYVEKQ